MVVGVLTAELHLPEARSLKDKRSHIKRIKDHLRSRFNVSVAEVEGHDLWQRAVVAFSCVGKDRPYVNGELSRIADALRRDRELVLIREEIDFV